MVELSDGCVCCNRGSNVLEAVYGVCSSAEPPAAVVVECSGVAETEGMAELFRVAAVSNDPVCRLARLSSLVTVVDSRAFPRLVRCTDVAADREDLGGGATAAQLDHPEKGVSQLLMEQVETADVIVLNKADTVGQKELSSLRATVEVLNPEAEVIAAEFGDVPLSVVLPSEGSGSGESRALARHNQKKRARGENNSAAVSSSGKEARYEKRFKVRSCVFKSNRAPFHPERLEALFNSLEVFMEMVADEEPVDKLADDIHGALRNVLRAKGTIWMADRPDVSVRMAAAGSRIELHPYHQWDDSNTARQELVVIGQGLDKKAVTALLEAALLTESEYAAHKADPEELRRQAQLEGYNEKFWCHHDHTACG